MELVGRHMFLYAQGENIDVSDYSHMVDNKYFSTGYKNITTQFYGLIDTSYSQELSSSWFMP